MLRQIAEINGSRVDQMTLTVPGDANTTIAQLVASGREETRTRALAKQG